MPENADLQRMQRQIAALSRVATTPGEEISAPARAAFLAKFKTRHECGLCGVVEIDQSLTPAQRQTAVAAAISAHFRRMALRSRSVRAKAKQLNNTARKMEAQLAAELAELDNAS